MRFKENMENKIKKPRLPKILSALSFCLIVAGVLAVGLLWQPAEAQGATTYSGYITGIEKQATAYTMLSKVNVARQNAGVGSLKWDTTLENAAITRAKEAAIYFSHTRPTGASWYTVCSKINAENLYVGYSASATTANSGWMNSAGHKANRLNGTYKSYGAAAFQGKDGAVYWVEVFSKTTSASASYRGVDVSKTDLAVLLTDGYLDVKGTITNLYRKTLSTNTMRVGGCYYMTLKNWNKGFSSSYTQYSKGFFASSDPGIATIDRVTGKITPVRAGVVKISARTSTDSDKVLGRWEVIRPQRVTGFVATAKEQAVSMKWDPIAGASGYEIYRATSANGTYSIVKAVYATTTSYTHTGLHSGTTYYYKVRAYIVKADSTTRYPGYSATPIMVKVL